MRKLRRTGLVLFMVFVLGAMGGSAARAAPGFEWTAGTTKFERATNTEQLLTFPGIGSFDCNEVLASAAVSGAGSETVTTTAGNLTYNDSSKGEDKCPASLGTFHITTNSCQFVIHAGGTMDIACPTGKALEWNVSGICLIKIGPQTGLTAVAYDDVTETAHMAITAKFDIHNLAFSTTGLCGTHSGTNAAYEGGITIIGTNSSGAQTDATWHS
jgi:hypothetical protein